MRAHLIGGADARGLLADLLFEPDEPALPMTTVRLALAAFVVGNSRQQKLCGIELGVGLNDALALLVQQLGQRFCFRLAALGKIDLYSFQALVGDLLKGRDEIGDIAIYQCLDARNSHCRRRTRIA